MLVDFLSSPTGVVVLHWLVGASAFGWLLGKLLARYISNKTLRDLLTRLGWEVRAVVLEVHQTWAEDIKKGKADGKLTEEEKAHAKALALSKLKENLGKKGIARLAKVLGLHIDALDSWLGNKIEATVAELKTGRPQ